MLADEFGIHSLHRSKVVKLARASRLVASLARGYEVGDDVAAPVGVAHDVIDAHMVCRGGSATITGIVPKGRPAPHAIALGAVAPPLEHLVDAVPAVSSVALVPAVVRAVGRCCHVSIMDHPDHPVNLFGVVFSDFFSGPVPYHIGETFANRTVQPPRPSGRGGLRMTCTRHSHVLGVSGRGGPASP